MRKLLLLISVAPMQSLLLNLLSIILLNMVVVYMLQLLTLRKHLTGLIILNCSVHRSILVSLCQSLMWSVGLIGILNYLLLYDGTVPFPIGPTFSVGSGVRQGSSLSPTLFNLYISAIIVSLKSSDYGCLARGKFFGCFLYADDIIIMSPSLHGLQSMLDICASSVCDRLSVKVNNIKSHCIVFGNCRKRNIENMHLGDDSINWVESIKYSGVHCWR